MFFDLSDKQSLTTKVYNHIRNGILDGSYKDGDFLVETRLAEELEVSRTPIREALKQLELEGLVLMIPRRGAIVAKITEKDLKDVLEVRASLERLSTKLACERMEEETIEELREAQEAFTAALRGDDITLQAQKDVEFHDVIYKSTNNLRLIQMLNNLREQMYRYRMEYLKDRNMYPALLKEHEAIREALNAHDRERAGMAIRTHIENQKESIINSLEEKE